MYANKSSSHLNDAERHFHAAEAYSELDDIPNLIAELSEAARLTKQGRSAVYWCLGHVLFLKGELKPAVTAFRDAIQLDPEDVDCFYELAFALCHSGDHVGEVQVLREALKQETKAGSRKESFRTAVSESGSWGPVINIQNFVSHYEVGNRALASALAESGDLAGAMAAYREAIRKNEYGNSDDRSYNSPLIAILMNQGPAKLIPEVQKAIGANPKLATSPAGFYLAVALVRSGDLPIAIDLIRRMSVPGALSCLDLVSPIVLIDEKRDLIATMRQLRDATKDEKAVVQWIDRTILLTERLITMGSRLPRIYHGRNYGLNYLIALQGGITFPSQFPNRRLYAAGADLWAMVFDLEPDLVNHYYHRIMAAECAAKTGCGEAKDQPPLDDVAKAKRRAQSLKWLQDLIATEVKLEENKRENNLAITLKELFLILLYRAP